MAPGKHMTEGNILRRTIRKSGQLTLLSGFPTPSEETLKRKCALVFKPEGALTTGYLLRGMDFFTDFYDDPVTFKLMDAIVDA